jgi:hypothetical protein
VGRLFLLLLAENMKSSFRRVKIGSLWKFKNSKPTVVVRVFEINKEGGAISISYGLRGSAAGHICCVLSGFIENYEWIKNAKSPSHKTRNRKSL